MSKYFVIVILLILLISCAPQKNKINNEEIFEKSYKEEAGLGFTEHLDSTNNIYSNFRYHVAFDAPDDWRTDSGVSEHTIFRAFQADSSITFSINAIEIRQNEKNESIDIWELYSNHKEQFDTQFKELVERQLKSEVKNLVTQKTYLRNNVCLKRSFNYVVREMDYEYDVTNISYQVITENTTFTFSLSLPTVFFNNNPDQYENLFRNIYFLNNREFANDIIKKSI